MSELTEAAAKMGRAGGSVKVPKGFSALSDEGRAAMAKKAAQSRWSGKTRVEQFWENVKKDSGIFKLVQGEMSECWVWLAGKSNKGYAYFSVNGKAKQAYKVAYEWERGQVPEGLELDHLCRTHECIRPDHQEAVTRLENQRRGDTFAGRFAQGNTKCPSGHEYDGTNKKGARTCSICNRILQAARRPLATPKPITAPELSGVALQLSEGPKPRSMAAIGLCLRGHPLDGINKTSGSKFCRTCARENSARWARNKRRKERAM